MSQDVGAPGDYRVPVAVDERKRRRLIPVPCVVPAPIDVPPVDVDDVARPALGVEGLDCVLPGLCVGVHCDSVRHGIARRGVEDS